jgi:competence protein ComGC
MSNTNINLASPKSNQLIGEEKWLKIARATALISMIFVASIAILVFVVNLTIPIQSVRNSEQAALADIFALHKRLVTYYLIKDRINNISNVIAKRKNLSTSANEIFNLVPPELSIKSFDADAKNISIVVSGNSLLPINKFIDDVVTESKKGKIIKNISIQELSVDTKHGSYSVSITGKIP